MDKTKSLCIEIGQRIYQRRKELGITQDKLAELTDTTPQAISNYERGERELRVSTIIQIANVLNISIDYLLTGVHTSFESLYEDMPVKDSLIIKEIVERCIKLINKE